MPQARSRRLHPLLELPLGTVCSLALALLAVAAAPARGEFAAAATSARSLEFGGVMRSYNVYAPPGYDALVAVPLVVDLHGLNSNNQQQQGLSGWQAKAGVEGFLVAYPQGTGNSWNAGTCCGSARQTGVDDVGFIRAMVAAIEGEAEIDPTRIYATGLSNGGAMSHRLACDAADLFAASAPLAFPTPYANFEAPCQPSRPIPVLTSMGLTDTLVNYNGSILFPSAAVSFSNWRAKNECGPEPLESFVELGGSFCDADLSCADDTRIGLCSIRGSFFQPPLDIYNGHLLYLNDDGIVMPNLIWSFFADDGDYFVAPEPEAGTLGAAALATLAWLGSLSRSAGGSLSRSAGSALSRSARRAHTPRAIR